MQVLRVCRFSTFALPPAFPPCCCPLAFQHQVRRLASRMSSESYPGYPECVVSCHGAGRFANSIASLMTQQTVSIKTTGCLCQKSGAKNHRQTGRRLRKQDTKTFLREVVIGDCLTP